MSRLTKINSDYYLVVNDHTYSIPAHAMKIEGTWVNDDFDYTDQYGDSGTETPPMTFEVDNFTITHATVSNTVSDDRPCTLAELLVLADEFTQEEIQQLVSA